MVYFGYEKFSFLSDPTGPDLMVKLLMMSAVEHKSGVDPELMIKPQKTFRSQALKIVALKVFAFFNWDLDILEDKCVHLI